MGSKPPQPHTQHHRRDRKDTPPGHRPSTDPLPVGHCLDPSQSGPHTITHRKFTLIDFYRVDIDNVTFKADDVWTATLTRLVHAAASKCTHICSLRRRYHSSGEQPPPRFLDRFQLLVAPLFSYGEYGQLYFSEALTRHLKCRDLHYLLDYATKRDDAASRGDAAPSDDAASAAAGHRLSLR